MTLYENLWHYPLQYDARRKCRTRPINQSNQSINQSIDETHWVIWFISKISWTVSVLLCTGVTLEVYFIIYISLSLFQRSELDSSVHFHHVHDRSVLLSCVAGTSRADRLGEWWQLVLVRKKEPQRILSFSTGKDFFILKNVFKFHFFKIFFSIFFADHSHSNSLLSRDYQHWLLHLQNAKPPVVSFPQLVLSLGQQLLLLRREYDWLFRNILEKNGTKQSSWPWNGIWVETVASRMVQNSLSKKTCTEHLLLPTRHGNAPVSTQIPFQLRHFAFYDFFLQNFVEFFFFSFSRIYGLFWKKFVALSFAGFSPAIRDVSPLHQLLALLHRNRLVCAQPSEALLLPPIFHGKFTHFLTDLPI